MTANGEQPRLGVVVPAYEAAAMIEATVRHVFAAAARVGAAVEVCVVDDGSTDGTADLVETLSQSPELGPRLTVVRQLHGGVAAARNRGVEALGTPWIAMLDADDRWTDAFFDALWPAALASTEPVVQGRLRESDADGGLGIAYEGVNLGTAIFRREAFDAVGPFDTTLPRLEDLDWFIRAHDLRLPKARLDAVVLHWTQSPGGLTASAPPNDPLMVRVHRAALARRRAGLAEPPPGYPTVQEYLGVPPPPAVRAPRAARHAELEPRSRAGRTRRRPTDVAVFACMRNEAVRLPAFLDHHRRIGVREFFVVDNGSDDGTAELLAAEPDVNLWHTGASFAAARCGTEWLLALLDRHGTDRWIAVLDADELLTYPDAEHRPVDELCRELEADGHDAALGVMVDLYPPGPLAAARYVAGDDPLAVFGWFDRTPWTLREERFAGHGEHPTYFGGTRQRVFGAGVLGGRGVHEYTVSKVPLLRYRPELQVADNFHWVEGARVGERRVALLHWKYDAAFGRRAEEETTRGEHWDGASQYRRYRDVAAGDGALSMFDASCSVAYEGTRQLVGLGVLEDPRESTTLPNPHVA